MRRLLVAGLLLVVPAWAAPAQAQFFKRASRPSPTQRVPELIYTVKADTDERKRASAADELQNFDARTYAEIVPVLVDVAQNDPKASVRQEALSSLARIRPVSPAAGQALERAAAQDDSWRIRLQAKSALVKYHLAGYSSAGKTDAAGAPVRNVTTAEPPLADPPGTAAPPLATPTPAPTQAAPQFPAAAFPAQSVPLRPAPTPSAPPVSQRSTPPPPAAQQAAPPAPITIEVEGPVLAPQP
jgi:hypothetical protein